MKLTQWLTILPEGVGLHGSGELWHRTIDTGFLPDRGDWVYTWTDNSDDGDGACSGFRLTPTRRYMDADGGWNIELQKVVVNPTAANVREIQGRDLGDGGEFDVYWESADGPVESAREMLRASGWALS